MVPKKKRKLDLPTYTASTASLWSLL